MYFYLHKLFIMKTFQKVRSIMVCMILFLLMISHSASSQEVIGVKNTQAQMSKGSQPCYVIEIPQADLKTVQQNWREKLQEGTIINVMEVNGELVLANCVKSEFTIDTINIYSLLIQKENKISMNVFVEIDTIFFAPKGDKADLASDKIDNNIKYYLHSFAVDQYKLAVADELEGQQKILKTKQNDLEKLEKDELNLKKDNSSLENDIDDSERKIIEIEKNIDMKFQEITTHNDYMKTVVLEADKIAAGDKQKQLEKEKKQMEKDWSRAKDDISSFKSKIEKNNKDIEHSKNLQQDKIAEITAQNEVITQVQTKLEGIK